MERPSGRYYEELNPGDIIRHALTRTVTETDNLLITTLTMNTQLLHLDEEFCKKHSIAGTRLVNSIFTLGCVVGVGVSDVSNGTTVGNLGFKDITFPAPVLIGDTLKAETEVLEKRESASRPDAGIVHFEHRGYNQRNELIARIHRIALMMKAPVEA
jgi:acyl dehydratase